MAVIPGQSVLNGSTPLEVFLTIFPIFLFSSITVLLTSIARLSITANQFRHFLFEFVLVIVPSVLTFTIYSENVKEISFFLGVFVIILLVIDKIKLVASQEKFNPSRLSWSSDFITNARSSINILTAIAILAVDFQIFPRQFVKTTTFGYSLMDTGVGLFIYSNGIVAPETKNKRHPILNSIKGSLILIILGAARLYLTSQVNYKVPEIEYGTHWNFFFTLAFTKIFTSLILNFFNIKYIYFNALLITVSHQVLLQSGLQHFVIYEKRSDSLISANKEGMVSLLGYVSIYLFSVYFGYLLNKNKSKSSFRVILLFIVASAVSLTLSLTFEQFFYISRRLANTAYCFWVLFIGIFMTGLFFVMQICQKSYFRIKKSPEILSPFIFKAVNYNGLVFFLIANVLTGLVNLCTNPWMMNVFFSVLILLGYMFFNCLVACVLYSKQLKLKL